MFLLSLVRHVFFCVIIFLHRRLHWDLNNRLKRAPRGSCRWSYFFTHRLTTIMCKACRHVDNLDYTCSHCFTFYVTSRVNSGTWLVCRHRDWARNSRSTQNLAMREEQTCANLPMGQTCFGRWQEHEGHRLPPFFKSNTNAVCVYLLILYWIVSFLNDVCY